MDTNFDYQDYRDAFLAALQGLITHNGLNMASEGHFTATVTNVDGLARAAARALRSTELSLADGRKDLINSVANAAIGRALPKGTFSKDGL